MATTLKLEIVTPKGQVYSQDVDMVTLPGSEGEMGILPQHAPLITKLGDGEIVAKRGGQEDRILVTRGMAEILGDRVSVLTVFATAEDNVDEKTAEEARARAEERLKQADLSKNEHAMVEASLAHASALLKLKRRNR
jgi:F-type H+-transporting ATPase subunit epsilon